LKISWWFYASHPGGRWDCRIYGVSAEFAARSVWFGRGFLAATAAQNNIEVAQNHGLASQAT
jgi:hypothetical protein